MKINAEISLILTLTLEISILNLMNLLDNRRLFFIYKILIWALIPTALALVASVVMSKERLSSSVKHQQAMGGQE
ncbi:hypothetical protein [Paenibacillus sp. GP183]|uniref:hypothetical protein n=1 Tax=Paenibacillus sp. GP183 TaxID=1882751 RepID=UPI000896ED2A|nr:hypothetical protein [Paenibacillus sp. GP183]SEB73793.1 hypothetical protein SAMN05443246_1749 [Paenibacillus sp. GP183]